MSSADENRGAGALTVKELDRLDRLEALAKAATAGPWQMSGVRVKLADPSFQKAQAHSVGPDSNGIIMALFDPKTGEGFMDAKFIAAFDPPTVLRLIAAARAATPTAPLAPPDAWTYRFRNGGEILWTYTRKTIEEVMLAVPAEHEDRFEFAPLYLAPPVVEAGGEGLRAEVLAFAHLMEAQLRANDHKPGWKGEGPFPLIRRLREETAEVFDAVYEQTDANNIGREAADVANFAMMIADVCGALSAHPAKEPSAGVAAEGLTERVSGVEGDRG